MDTIPAPVRRSPWDSGTKGSHALRGLSLPRQELSSWDSRPRMWALDRTLQELEDLLEQLPPYLRDLSGDDDNVLVWNMLLLPEQPPYNLKAFRLRIDFPREYPLKPPTLKFITKIYHPNISKDGLVCLPLVSIRNWKPYTKTYQVLEALIMLVNKPNLEEPVQLELAELLTQNPEMFKKNAEEFTLRFGEDRPA